MALANKARGESIMPDHVGDSAEHIAFRLFEMILEKDPPKAPLTLNATWILTTYARCLRTVRNPELPGKPEGPRLRTN
jgi:hypothetical protein